MSRRVKAAEAAPAKKRPVKLKAGQITAPRKGVLALPATGGYVGGYETGRALALATLKNMRGNPSPLDNTPIRNTIAAFMDLIQDEGHASMRALPVTQWPVGYDSRRGQYIGFINEISRWAEAAAKHLGSQLAALSDDHLAGMASDGLNFDTEAVMAHVKLTGGAA